MDHATKGQREMQVSSNGLSDGDAHQTGFLNPGLVYQESDRSASNKYINMPQHRY
jgi:hypothetical protein